MFAKTRMPTPVLISLMFFALSFPAEMYAAEVPASTKYGEEAVLFQEIPSVLGASKYEQKVTEAPSSVSIVTAAEIAQYGYRTLADILRNVRGFYITYDRDYSYVGVRGFGRPGDYNSRILLLIDGHRANENYYDSVLIGTEGILDVDLIDRVEVIRGPGSSLYGNNAFFAVINILTKRGRDLKGAEVSGEAGSFRTAKGRASYGDRYQNGTEAILSGTGYDSKGDRLYFKEFDQAVSSDPRAGNNGHADGTDYDRYQNYFTKLSHRDLTLEGAYSSRTKGVPTGIYGTDFNDPGNKTVDTRSFLDLKYEHGLGKLTDLTARVYYDYYHYTGFYPASVIYGALNMTQQYGEWRGGEVKLSTRLLDAHRVIVGAEYTDNFRKDHKNFDVEPYHVYDDAQHRSEIWAAYLQDEVQFSGKFIVNAGVRYDHYSTFGSTVNPRLALIFIPQEKSSLKFLYGTAFRAPNDYEMFANTDTQLGNPDVQPEKIKTYELVYEQYVNDRLHMSAAAYYYRITDLINTMADPATGLAISRNIDDVEAKGVELELENKWTNGVDGRISLALQRAVDQTTDKLLTNSPAEMLRINLVAPAGNRVFAGAEEQCTGKRRTLADGYAGAFCITNLTVLSPNALPRLDVSASVYNLLNKAYVDPGSEGPNPPLQVVDRVRQDGRTYRLKVTYAF